MIKILFLKICYVTVEVKRSHLGIYVFTNCQFWGGFLEKKLN